ncbi:MAG: hypothetical protein UX80_C0033G0009 [Candidatus Amesbacteria bacterium GW2011_GWA2_47_11b]|uniref:Uncharacterized protein n=2 Tax=Candidatus Amesiibacteriota TaxID=1752730 RepID=A0A0G1RHQ9_9BACT|nr:MAG: hypothetical protein UX42_C0028G0005 [Microgenomates group bacterium GW2011_GWC1_46_20]KKU56671.1 MAG: hypothetical protein UX80_C0033G0009 [Candidatus Amesbacteria bacterium GW2011_GWA2_47_11b]KKU83013.1 MAG: hypothetical protein UY11_C0032G0009 [Candidatus Amesbacteria bacterium GW2011_GWC2_47_8]
MDYITTTQLRTKSPRLIEALLAGRSIDLIHRSRMVGEIRPKRQDPKIMTKKSIRELMVLAKKMNLPKLSYKEREKRYREHLMKKYGKSLS